MKEVIDTVSVALANGQPEEAGNVVMQELRLLFRHRRNSRRQHHLH